MKVNVFHVDQDTGAESLNNVRHTDEIAEDNGMTDAEACHMESEIRKAGRFWLGGGAAPLFVLRRVEN